MSWQVGRATQPSMPPPTFRTFAAIAIAVLAAIPGPRAADPPPKLVVLLMVDQMRADYVDRFKADWTGGLGRMVDTGAWFRRAAYPYLSTVTCAGHATVSTGAFPHVHGIFQNTWWDRGLGRVVNCVEDPNVADIGYTIDSNGGEGPGRLTISTFADEMRAQRSAHVVSMALKDRSAIMLAGHGGDAVTWLNPAPDAWVTSSAFSKAPISAVKAFVDANPIAADFGKSWTPLLPAARYREADAGPGETPPNGWTALFPHVLNGASNKADATFRTQWERSPFADAYVGRFAAALAESMQLGKHEGTDVLAISFSSPDLVGHVFGPRSLEVHDEFVRLDRTIGALFARLDVLVGPTGYVVALGSDHGVTPLPEQLAAADEDGGRFSSTAIAEAIDRQASAALGGGPYVANVSTNDVYFHRGKYEQLAAAPAAMAAVIKAIEQLPGIARVFRREDLGSAAHARDKLLRAAALSYVPGRGGDLIVAKKRGWMVSGIGTTHGSASPDDQRVPILFMGPGIKPGWYNEPATPADIAPTLAALYGVTLPRAEGHALRAALR
jgi:predicted AlkP superfamily pyrophosphatase or phosphodiesterase